MEIMSARRQGSLGKGAKIKGGCVRLAPGKSVGRHSTGTGEEFILVLEGVATAVVAGKENRLNAKDCIFIPSETEHDVFNHSKEDLIYVYFVAGKDGGAGNAPHATKAKAEG